VFRGKKKTEREEAAEATGRRWRRFTSWACRRSIGVMASMLHRRGGIQQGGKCWRGNEELGFESKKGGAGDGPASAAEVAVADETRPRPRPRPTGVVGGNWQGKRCRAPVPFPSPSADADAARTNRKARAEVATRDSLVGLVARDCPTAGHMASSAAAPAGEASTSEPAAKGKPIVVRVKRKPSQTRPDAFCELPFLPPWISTR
jgi:hypothetical protein